MASAFCKALSKKHGKKAKAKGNPSLGHRLSKKTKKLATY